jgi:uroporphyrinogen decarboxylase
VQGPIQRPEDLRTYTPPDPDRPGVLGHLPEVVARYKGRKPIIFMARDAFFHPTFLRGMDNYLMDMVINPHLVHELVEVCQSHDLKVMEKAVQAGADIIVFGDDYACNTGPLMSPKHFREFVLPGLRKAVRRAKEAGAYVIKHTDGNLEPLLDMIVDTGIDALHSIEPAAGMDIGQVKARYGDRIALIGNIDCGHLLSHGTTDEVRAAVRACLAAAAPGGGHLLSSSNSIHSSVRPENYLAMVEALREYGNYPLAW